MLSSRFLATAIAGVLSLTGTSLRAQAPARVDPPAADAIVETIVFSGDGERYLTIQKSGAISLTEADSQSSSLSNNLDPHAHTWVAAFDRTGTKLVFASAFVSYITHRQHWLELHQFKTWDLQSKNVVAMHPAHRRWIIGAHLHPDSPVLTVIDWGGGLSVLDTKTGQPIKEIPGDGGLGLGITDQFQFSDLEWRTAFSASGSRCGALIVRGGATPGHGLQLSLWDIDAQVRAKVYREKADIRRARCLALSPDGRRFALGFADSWSVEVRDFDTMEPIQSLEGDNRTRVDALIFSNSGHSLLAGHGDGDVEVWDTKTGGFVKQLSAEGRAGKIRAMYASDKKIRIARGGLRQEPPTDEPGNPDAKIDPLTVQDVPAP